MESRDNLRQLSLLKALLDPELRDEAIAWMVSVPPDPRSLEAYVEGLSSRDAALRETCLRAIRFLEVEWIGPPMNKPRHYLKERLEIGGLPRAAILELRKIFGGLSPVRRWRVLGPMVRNDEPKKHFDVKGHEGALSREDVFDVAFRGKRGDALWTTVRTAEAGGYLDLRSLMSDKEDASAFAHAAFSSGSAGPSELVIGGDDSIAVWLNGEEVHRREATRPWKADGDRVAVSLKAGPNALLVKCGQGADGWGFSVQVRILKIQGLLTSRPPEKEDPEEYLAFAMKGGGDAARGKQLVTDGKFGCARCHKVGGVGPPFRDAVAKLDAKGIAESLLHPTRTIRKGYEVVRILIREGRIHEGILAEKALGQISLRYPNGIKTNFLTQQYVWPNLPGKILPTRKSLMPPVLNNGITLQEFADLVAYLKSLK